MWRPDPVCCRSPSSSASPCPPMTCAPWWQHSCTPVGGCVACLDETLDLAVVRLQVSIGSATQSDHSLSLVQSPDKVRLDPIYREVLQETYQVWLTLQLLHLFIEPVYRWMCRPRSTLLSTELFVFLLEGFQDLEHR